MYGGAGSYPSQYLGQSSTKDEARRQAISDSVKTMDGAKDDLPDWLDWLA